MNLINQQIAMEDDIKAKQDYLYKEIIEENYDPEQFQEYIQTIKGLSLELYSLSELISIVEAFKKREKYSKQVQEGAHVLEIDPSFMQHSELSKQIQSKIQQDSFKNSEIKIEGNSDHQYESSNSSNNVYHEFLLKSTVSQIYIKIHQKKQKIRVKIRSYSKVQQESFFGSTYVCYLVETPQMGWSVNRRFNDFEWLQAKITQIIPGYPIPPIPKKTAMRSFDDQHLQQRMNTFERYLTKLLSIPEICSEPIFQQFLSVSSDQEFTSCKQKFNISLKSRGNKLITLKGQNLIDKSEYKLELKEFQFYKHSKQLLHRLNTQINNLQTLLKQTTTKAFDVSSILNEFHNHLQSKNIISFNVIEVIDDFMSELGYKLQKEHNFLRKEIQSYWSYQQKYLQNIVTYMSKINKQHYEMLNKYKSMSNFQVDSDQQTKNKTNHKKVFLEYQQARQIYRVKLSFLRSEIVRYEQNDFASVAKQWVNGLKNYMTGVRQLMISGVDQLTKAECVAEGKKLVQVEYIAKKGVGGDSKKNQ